MHFSALLETILQQYAQTNKIPDKLVQRAWAESESRQAMIDMLLESLQKLGGFDKVSFWMAAISASISCADIAGLYRELRSRSVRNELEWRLVFQAAFPQCKEQLPPIEERSIRSYDVEDALLGATRKNNSEGAALLIDCMLRIGLDPCAVRIASLEDLGLSDDDFQNMDSDDLATLIRKVNEERGIQIRDYAVELGHERIVQLLDSAQK
jgi:hypothetical protein